MMMHSGGGAGRVGGRLSRSLDDDLRSRKTDRRTLRRVAQAFKPYKWQVVAVLVAILITGTLGLVNPYLLKLIIDDAFAHRDYGRLVWYVSLMIATPIVTGLIGVWQTYLNNIIGQRVMRDFRNRLYGHLQNMALRFFTNTRTGEIQSRLSNDIGGVQNVVTSTASSVVSNFTTAISTIVAMVIISWPLTVLSLGLLPFFLFLTYKVGNVRRGISKETQKSLADLSAMVEETLSVSGVLLTKTFGRQKRETERFATENQRLTDLQVRQQMIGRWFFMFIGTFFSITPALVYWLAGAITFGGLSHVAFLHAITIGDIVAFTTLQSRLFFPIGQLLNVQVDIQGALALFDRIFEYLDLPLEITDKPDALALKPQEVRGQVAFRAVTFRYENQPEEGDVRGAPYTGGKLGKLPARVSKANGSPSATPFPTPAPAGAPVLQASVAPATVPGNSAPVVQAADEEAREPGRPTLENVSFEIQPGQLAALVGPSGAGKTTITYLLPRLYDVQAGAVEIDGHDVREVTLASLGETIGVVTQETYLFHATVRENLLYGKPDATDEEMMAAAQAAAIHERISELPEGYDTVVGERGYKLSGGEKQRLALARVILKNPRILILDEATSALDTHSERLIQAALEPLMKGRTTLAIAHRLSTILAADLILVVEKGQIVERGTHAELLARNGLYARLYKEQFSAAMEGWEQIALDSAPAEVPGD
ncbi:MAG TPA: ABC transporter transmembrane domain-containing protein [Ktedonobacterales bacterium]|jgi:ATP-binding cassette subfamily B protein